MKIKKCNKCGSEKELKEFYNDKNSKDGVVSHCMECQKIYSKEYREKNKETLKKKKKEYYHKNRDKLQRKSKAWRKRHYGYINKIKKRNYETNIVLISDQYAIDHLKRKSPLLKDQTIPNWLIELYRANLLLKRKLWEIKRNEKK